MIKEYICRFKRNKQIQSLVFDIDKNPISEQWSKLVEYHIQHNNVPRGVSNGFTGDKESLTFKIQNLCERIGLEVPQVLDQNTLNDLHKRFHFLEEQNNMGNKRREFHDLNTAIHRLENIYKHPGYKYYKWYINGSDGPKIKIQDDHWKYYRVKFFKYDRPHGLYLGYHTIGKDILSTFADRDIDLVKNDGVRQPIYFSTETLYRHGRHWRKNQTNNTKRWLRKNACAHLIDFNQPKYKYYQTFPRIGSLRLDKPVSEIEDIFTNYTMISVDIA